MRICRKQTRKVRLCKLIKVIALLFILNLRKISQIFCKREFDTEYEYEFYENKIYWREKFNPPSPKINEEIKIHNHNNYPKYLLKPKHNFKSRGIELYNQSNFIEHNNSFFLEEFIPSKLIDNHCYSIRVIMIVNKENQYPVLYTLRKCENPIIENLTENGLTEEQSLSYISNRSTKSPDYEIYENEKLIEFVNSLKIHD